MQRQLAPVQAPVVAELSTQAAAAEQAVPEAADAPEVCCPQGEATMQRRGTRARQVPTRQGVWVAVRRADAPCPACGAGHFPLDAARGWRANCPFSPQALGWRWARL